MARKKQEIKPAEDTKLHDYELVVIVSPEVADDALESRVNTITQFITGREGVIGGVEKWGKRKLAYPIQHFLEGNYVLTRFKISPARCKELETNLKISEEILRHMLVRVDG
ncbi:MAG: 30S ribosomal protein S6 [Chloroflexota bacterium]